VSWFGVAKSRGEEIRYFLGVSVWNFAGDLIAKALLASDVVVLGLVVSTANVTTYVLTGYAAQMVVGVITLALRGLTPGLGGVLGEGRLEKAAAVRREMLAVCWLLVAAGGSSILLWNRSFLHLWVGSENYAGQGVNLLIVLLMVQTVFIRADGYVIDSTLRLRRRVLLSGAAGLVSVALMGILVWPLGTVGLCLGSLMGRLIQTVSYPVVAAECLGRRRVVRPAWVLRPALVMTVLFSGSAYLGGQVLVSGRGVWACGAVSSFAGISGVALWTGLASDSRRELVKRFRVLLSARS